MRDTDIRTSAPPRIKVPGGTRGGAIFEGEILKKAGGGAARWIGRGILGPIGGVIDVATPSDLGSGELEPGEMIEDVLRQSEEETDRVQDILNDIGRDIARGGGIIAAGGVIGGGIVLDQIGRLPPVIDVGDEPVLVKDVPRPEIPAPVFKQPSLPGGQRVPQTSLPLPPPARMPSRSSQTVPQSKRVGSPSRFPAPTAPPMSNVWGIVAQSLGSALRGSTRRSSLTLPRSTALNRLQDTIATQPATSAPPISGLTSFNPQVLTSSSAPPRLRTRTRQDECNCEPKRKRKPRKCRASAPLTWAGGPRKGQSAGSRCYSFEGK